MSYHIMTCRRHDVPGARQRHLNGWLPSRIKVAVCMLFCAGVVALVH
jgi:hypothetical protein